ncbi:hypothetical protein EBL_c27490 [Shimwellia blattae DSM 4481 = NBRC 105725]|uniref:Uncharacterized protein n=1 Tax=Shimwellia blattae (strain ATCC 29907 / DSM 4481 / JCM 1650 / NBRC 105725 / CDC 9005-74) TaxID=630626 RepID=I2BBB6_SHIBC|nr:hypothetical protein EBL_c27490 [Shimwellia blattae DSM 4481 = NBRC 105725]
MNVNLWLAFGNLFVAFCFHLHISAHNLLKIGRANFSTIPLPAGCRGWRHPRKAGRGVQRPVIFRR